MPRNVLRLGILSCLAAFSLARAAGSSEFLLFPVLDPGAGEFLGLSLVNTAGQANEAMVTWTNEAGTSLRTGVISLPPGAQRVMLVREILGLELDPADGWIRIDPSGPGVLAYLTSGKDGMLDGLEPVSQPATTVFLEHIAVDTGFVELEHTDTFVTMVNPGSVAAETRAELIGLDGSTAGTLALSIPASGSRTIRISKSFGNVLPVNNAGGLRFEGYMKVLSATGLACWLRVETPLSRRLLRGRAPGEITPTTLALAGHFASGSAMHYRSTLNLINLGDTPVQLQVGAQDERGNGIGAIATLRLDVGQNVREDVLSLFRIVTPAVFPPPLVTGSIRIRASGGSPFQVIGDVDIHGEGNAFAMTYPVTAASSRSWTLPFAISTRDYWTGYVTANPNELLTVQADVTVELLNMEGEPAAPTRRISLSPSARFAALVDKEIPSGYLRIQSNLPIIVVGSIGTSNGNALASLPALR